MKVFGPVPSRRLGRSLGLNNLPPKHCPYSCIYCQLGRTRHLQIEREEYHSPRDVAREVEEFIRRLKGSELAEIDYLTFIADGEPTLDANLGGTIEELRQFQLPIAVISNAALISREDVREDLSRADWVSLKCDAVSLSTWKAVNRPHGQLDHAAILRGIETFARDYSGELDTETMLVDGYNDDEEEFGRIADFLRGVKPSVAYVAVPTRPPAEDFVEKPPRRRVELAREIFTQAGLNAGLLVDYEGDEFTTTGDARDDLLRITAVHPMTESAVKRLLERCNADWGVVESLIERDQLREVSFYGATFYIFT